MDILIGYFAAGLALWLAVFGSHRIWSFFQRLFN